MVYGSNPYYPYHEYNNTSQDHQHQHDQMNGYFGYAQEGHGYQQSQQVEPPTDESLNPLQHLAYQNDWSYSGAYDSYNQVAGNNWSIGQQQQNYNDNGTSQVFTNQIVNNNIPNQSNDPYFPSLDEVPISDLIESVYKDVSLPSHSQSWNQNASTTDTGHRPSNQLNNLVPSVNDHLRQHGSKSYSQTVSYHQEPTPYQELNNNNLVSSNTDYLVPTPGYVLSQLESSTLPDVTTTQSQLSQNVSPITASLAIDHSSMVLEVNCFKCKLCSFISLDKSNVFNHINASHKSSGQLLTNIGTEQVVSEVNSSLAREGDELNGSHEPQFLVSKFRSRSMTADFTVQASSDISSLLNEPASMSGSTTENNPVISKQPVKLLLAPKVMPPILVHAKQTKTSHQLTSSINPSNQTSITSIIIDTSSQSKSKSRTKHSKAALIRVEQGNKTPSKSFLKSKDVRKSLKSSVKKKVKKEVALWFYCEFDKCTAKFMSENTLERHIKCHIPGEEIGFKCTICDTFTAGNWATTAGHLWREHAVDLELHKCEFCNYRSYSLSILENQHKRIHSNEKNYVCDLCSKGFKNNKQLVNHRKRHSKPQVPTPVVVEVKKLECEFCFKIFKDRRAFMVHQNSVHKKKHSYSCNSCGHLASSRSALRTHVRSHTGEKPFKCDQCDYNTSDHNSLRRHKMRHSGERPYKCPFCDYACIQVCQPFVCNL